VTFRSQSLLLSIALELKTAQVVANLDRLLNFVPGYCQIGRSMSLIRSKLVNATGS
jgi:hypothetical protein